MYGEPGRRRGTSVGHGKVPDASRVVDNPRSAPGSFILIWASVATVMAVVMLGAALLSRYQYEQSRATVRVELKPTVFDFEWKCSACGRRNHYKETVN